MAVKDLLNRAKQVLASSYSCVSGQVKRSGVSPSDLESLEPRVLLSSSPVFADLEDESLNETNSVYIWFEFTDYNENDTHTATVDWGDGSAVESLYVNQQYYDPYYEYVYDGYDYYTYTALYHYEGYLAPGDVSGDHVYADDGSFTVTVTVTDNNGDSTAKTFTATVDNIAPTLTVTGNSTAVTGQVYTLNLGASDPGPDTISQWGIDWGDGNNETVMGNPSSATHTYSSGGAMSIVATATDEDGSYAASAVGVSVTVSNVAPVVDALTDLTINEGGTLNLAGTFSDVNGADTHTATVNWGDGSAVEALTVGAGTFSGSHVYADSGAYNLSVTVRDNGGLSDSDVMVVTVDNVAPTLTVTGDSTVAVDADYTLNLGVSDPGVDTVSQWSINWGDGNVEVVAGNPASVTHAYAVTGAFAVVATATDEDGSYAAAAVNVTASWAPVLAGLVDETFNEGGTLNLAATFSDGDAVDSHTATVDWGDGSAVEALTVGVGVLSGSHVYADNGQHTVVVTVTDSRGYEDTDSLLVTVNNVPPTLTVSGGGYAVVDQDYVLNLGASDPGPDSISGWSIDWGDGYTDVVVGNPSSVTHVYALSGAYSIVATATDEDGSYAAATVYATARAHAVITAVANKTSNEADSVSLFTAFVDADVTDTHTATVDWGDGSAVEALALTGQYYDAYYTYVYDGYDYDTYTALYHYEGYLYPGDVGGSHVYADDGSYNVTVTVTDQTGAAGVSSFDVTVSNVAPVVGIGGSVNVVLGDVYTLYLNASDPGADTISQWDIDWGDGNAETVLGDPLQATHVYSGQGAKTISATATDEDGTYSATSTRAIDVRPAGPVFGTLDDLVDSEGSLVNLIAYFEDYTAVETHRKSVV